LLGANPEKPLILNELAFNFEQDKGLGASPRREIEASNIRAIRSLSTRFVEK